MELSGTLACCNKQTCVFAVTRGGTQGPARVRPVSSIDLSSWLVSQFASVLRSVLTEGMCILNQITLEPDKPIERSSPRHGLASLSLKS